MIRSVVRGVAIAAIAAGTALGAQVAGATAFTFSFTDAQSNPTTAPSSLYFSDASCSNGAATCSQSQQANLGVNVYGGHLNSVGTSTSTISLAALEEYKGAGLGVLFGSDKEGNGTHQIDNFGGGSDMVALVFDQAVSLSSISRASYTNQYSIAKLGSDTDVSFLAYTGDLNALGDSSTKLSLADFSSLDSGSNSTGTKATSKIWLVAANVTGQTNDAFKITGLVANVANAPGSVPEPASWAMMIVGFGAVGSQLRRRSRIAAAAA